MAKTNVKSVETVYVAIYFNNSFLRISDGRQTVSAPANEVVH